MKNPYRPIVENGSFSEALLTTASMSDDMLHQVAQQLTEEEFVQLGCKTFTKLQGVNVHSTLYLGGLLHLYQAAASRSDRNMFFQNLIEDLGISSTKAYASIAIFKTFGKDLLQEPELIQRFPVEALKILAAKDVSQEARIGVLERARTGERITIKCAHALVADQGGLNESQCSVAPVKKTHRPVSRKAVKKQNQTVFLQEVWSYSDPQCRLRIEASKPDALPRISLIHFLEAAIEQCRREQSEHEPSDAA